MLRQIILVLVAGIGTSKQIPNVTKLHIPETKERLCQDKECQRLGTFVLGNINEFEDPCNDFEKYACGNRQNVSIIKNLHFTVRDEIREMLEKPLEVENLKSLDIERKLYETCMQSAKHGFENKLRFLSILQSMDGLRAFSPLAVPGFKKSWQESDMDYAMLGFKLAFFDIKIEPDIRNTSNNIIAISPPLARRSANGIINTTYGINFTSELSAALIEVVKLNSEINDDMQQQKRLEYKIISQFAANLEKIIRPPRDTRFIPGDLMTVQDWEKLYNEAHHLPQKAKINWLELLKKLLSGNHIIINELEMVYIERKKYFEELALLFAETPTDVINAYVHLHFVYQAYQYADTTEEDLINHSKSPCLRSSNLVGVYHQYVKKQNLQENRESANRMVESIRQHILFKSFEKLTNDSSLAYAKYRMAGIKMSVGYPAWIHNMSLVDNYYNDLDIGTNYFQNMVNYMGFIQQRSLARLRNPKLDPWISGSTLSNSMGDMNDENAIVFSVDFLRYPEFELFHSIFPQSVNYGSLGTTISMFWFSIISEIGRGVRSMSSDMRCFATQTNTSTMENEVRNSMGVGYRKMIFFNALHASYQLFESQQNNNIVRKVKGLETFTDQQLFFLSFANGICGSQFWWSRISVNQILRNMPEFAEAFRCSSDSPMNGKHKCPASSIWER